MTLYPPNAIPIEAGAKMSRGTFAVYDPDPSTAPFNHERSSIPHSSNPDTEEDCPNEVLMCAVEQGLSTLGQSVAQVILYNIDKRYSLKRRDIVKEPNRFVEALQSIFGSGAETIQKLIIQSICSATGVNPSTLSPPTLQHCLRQAEKALATKKKTKN